MLGLAEALPITSVYQLGLALGYALIAPTAFAWWQRMPARAGAAAGLACLVAGVGIMTVAKTGQVPVLGVVGVVVWALAPLLVVLIARRQGEA